MVSHTLLKGANFADERGVINFFNTFNMGEIVRMYEIAPNNINTIRAWQGHKHEKKWFYCHTGSFVVNIVMVDDFENPSLLLKPKRIVLEAKNLTILELSGGYATGIKGTEENSVLQVFSNFSLEASKNDDFRYAIENWNAKW